jgi:hypothetical protein
MPKVNFTNLAAQNSAIGHSSITRFRAAEHKRVFSPTEFGRMTITALAVLASALLIFGGLVWASVYANWPPVYSNNKYSTIYYELKQRSQIWDLRLV